MGAFLYEMVVGVPPYYNSQPLVFQENNSPHFVSLVKGLIEEQVDKRIGSFKTIKEHKWMSELDWTKLKNM